jgi:uncharacterized protein YegJ (DUF2314 family)
MNAAIEKAQATLDQFLTALASPKPSQTYFSVKARFPYPNGSGGTSYEHIWLDNVSYTDGQFSGLIGNEPVEVTSLHLAQKVTVPKADITDWFIIDNNHMLGGYTVRVLRDRMTNDERQKFDQEWGVVIDQ